MHCDRWKTSEVNNASFYRWFRTRWLPLRGRARICPYPCARSSSERAEYKAAGRATEQDRCRFFFTLLFFPSSSFSFFHFSLISPILLLPFETRGMITRFELRASSFRGKSLKKRIDGWRKICETGEKVKRCELAERRRFPIYVNFNFPFVLISRYLPFDRSICVINNVTSTSDVTINSGG